MIISLLGIVSYIVVTLVINTMVKRESIWKQKRLLMFLEAYILSSLVVSIFILIGRNYLIAHLRIELIDASLNFILHILLVPYAWLLLIRKSGKS